MDLTSRKQSLLAELNAIQARIAAGEASGRALTEYLGGLPVLDCKLLLAAVEENDPLRGGRFLAGAHNPGSAGSTPPRATNPSAMSAAAI